jgi:hypothetical protein
MIYLYANRVWGGGEGVGRVLAPSRMQPIWPFIYKGTSIDNSSDNEISSILSINNDFFYKHFILEWSYSKSEDDFDLMIAVTSVLHEDSEAQFCQWKGSMSGQAGNLDRNQEAGHVQVYNDY